MESKEATHFPKNGSQKHLQAKPLQVHNPRFITYRDDLFTVDVLGGVDLQQVERMICTLRITHGDYPPTRTTLDLYTDGQTEKLIRNLCDRFHLPLTDCSRSVHTLIAQLESYKLEKLRYPQVFKGTTFEMTPEEAKAAREYLRDPNLIANLKNDLRSIGIVGEEENPLILFLAMASHRYGRPVSVLYPTKDGAGRSYLLRTLSGCMPAGSYSFHTEISENAFYYSDEHQIDGKVLFIEDLSWTDKMLTPLAALQTQGRLTKTRATKDKDGMLHSTTFEVTGKLCLIAGTSGDKKYERSDLPFICLSHDHNPGRDAEVTEYIQRCRAGLVDQAAIRKTQRHLQCVIASLGNTGIINPFAVSIRLPEGTPNPRRTLLLLLDFIDVITFMHQHQRERHVDEETGEVSIKTHPDDVALALSLLNNNLLRDTDELSAGARSFYGYLKRFLKEAKTDRFTGLDLRKANHIHPRTLNRHLQELTAAHYIQVAGGNRHRGGYQYRLTGLDGDDPAAQGRTEQHMRTVLADVWNGHGGQNTNETVTEENHTAEPPKTKPARKPKRIDTKEGHTLELLRGLEAVQPGRQYLADDFCAISGRSYTTEARYLKALWERGILQREWKDRQYYYSLAATGSGPVGQSPVSYSESPAIQAPESGTVPEEKTVTTHDNGQRI